MDIEEVREYTLSLFGVTEDQPFGDDIITFRVEGKIFLCLWLGGDVHDTKNSKPRFAFKLTPERNEELREHFSTVTPAWHWNKKHWSDVYFENTDERLVREWIRESYHLIITKLPKAVRTHYEVTVVTATSKHHHYIPDILSAIHDATLEKGTSIVMRDPTYLAHKMDEGKAVIAIRGDEFVGFCYLECWENERFVANSGMIVRPEFRGQGVATRIKAAIVQICRAMFPEAKIFGITKSQAVIKMSLRLGFTRAPYSALTTDPAFWKGCATCPHYQTLLANNGQTCECQGLLFDPDEIIINN